MRSFACLSLCNCAGHTSKHFLSLLRSHLNFCLSLTCRFSLFSVHSSKMKVGEKDVCVSIKTSNRLAPFVMFSFCEINNKTFLYSSLYLRLFHPLVSPNYGVCKISDCCNTNLTPVDGICSDTTKSKSFYIFLMETTKFSFAQKQRFLLFT